MVSSARSQATRIVQIGILDGSLSLRLCKVVGRVAHFFFSPLESPQNTRALGDSIRVLWHHYRSLAHTVAQLYLPLLCQLALQHYLSALEWLAVPPVGRSDRPNGSDVVALARAPGPVGARRGQSVR